MRNFMFLLIFAITSSCYSKHKISYLENDKYRVLQEDLNFNLVMDLEKKSLSNLVCYGRKGVKLIASSDSIYYNSWDIDNDKIYSLEMDSIINSLNFKNCDTLYFIHVMSDEWGFCMIDDGEKFLRIDFYVDQIKIEQYKSTQRNLYLKYTDYLTNCPNLCEGTGGYAEVFSIFIKQKGGIKYKTNWCCSFRDLFSKLFNQYNENTPIISRIKIKNPRSSFPAFSPPSPRLK